MKCILILTLLFIAVTQTFCDNVWVPVFMGFAGNGISVETTWQDTTIQDDILQQYSLTGNSRHLRNEFINNWGNVKMVKLELLDVNFKQLMWLTFNGEGTSNTDWFSQTKITGSSFNDLTFSSTFNFFSLEGDSAQNSNRKFLINRSYGGGCNDNNGWFFIADTYGTCLYEQIGIGTLPLFLYTDNYSNRDWYAAKNYASILVISVSTF